MKNCEYYGALISRLLDDDLTAEEKASLEEHLLSCPDCRRFYDALSQMRDALRDDAMQTPPAALAAGVMDRVAAHSRPAVPSADRAAPSRRLRSWKKLAAAACFVVLVAAGAVTGVFGRGARLSGAGNAVNYQPEAQNDVLYAKLPEDAAEDASGQQADSLPDTGAWGTAEDSRIRSALSGAADRTPPEAVETEEEAVENAENGIMPIMEPPEAAADGIAVLPVTDADGRAVGSIADAAALEALLTGEALDTAVPEAVYCVALQDTAYCFAGAENGGLLWWRAGDSAPTLSPAALADFQALIVSD